MVTVRIYEKEEVPNCGDADCCGYSYEEGRSEEVTIEYDTYIKLEAELGKLLSWETVDARELGITTKMVDSIGYMSERLR